jgi:hypothetical protein
LCIESNTNAILSPRVVKADQLKADGLQALLDGRPD